VRSPSSNYAKSGHVGWLLCFLLFTENGNQLAARTLGKSTFADTIGFYDASVEGKMNIRTSELTNELWRGSADIKILKIYRDKHKYLKSGRIFTCEFSFNPFESDVRLDRRNRYISINYDPVTHICSVERTRFKFGEE
jgi:hypothetical protein